MVRSVLSSLRSYVSVEGRGKRTESPLEVGDDGVLVVSFFAVEGLEGTERQVHGFGAV